MNKQTMSAIKAAAKAIEAIPSVKNIKIVDDCIYAQIGIGYFRIEIDSMTKDDFNLKIASLEAKEEITKAVEEIARKHGITTSQVIRLSQSYR